MKSTKNQNVKVVRYTPEHAMGHAKFRRRRRVVVTFIPSVKRS